MSSGDDDKRGIKYGYRSGFEGTLAMYFKGLGIRYLYEQEKLSYIQPEKKRQYTPDFVLTKKDGGKMYIEAKGLWTTEDRQKHLLIKEQHPDLDIRLVFMNPHSRIRKGSKTTYAMYCAKHGLVYSPLRKKIPDEWLKEVKFR